MTRRRWVWLAAVIGLVLVWWMIVWQPNPELPLPGGDMEASTPALVSPQRTVAGAEAAPVARAPAQAAEPEPAPAASAEEPFLAVHPMERENLRPPPVQGPMRAFRHQFAGESRAAHAPAAEARIRALFDDVAVPKDLLDTVACRRTLCRIDVLWTPEYVKSYVSMTGFLQRDYAGQIAMEAANDSNAEGARPIELYVKLADK